MFSRILIAGAAAAMLLGAAATSSAMAAGDLQLAQYYPPPPPPGYGSPPPGYGYGPPPAPRWARVCRTSRGDCGLSEPTPRGAGCRCMIPGFGPKRGEAW